MTEPLEIPAFLSAAARPRGAITADQRAEIVRLLFAASADMKSLRSGTPIHELTHADKDAAVQFRQGCARVMRSLAEAAGLAGALSADEH